MLARSLPERALHAQHDRIFHLDMPDGWDAAYLELTNGKRRADDRRRLRWQHRVGESGGFKTNEESWGAVAGRLAADGNVLMVLLRLDGDPVAFTYNFAFNGTLWGHRLANAPGHDGYSPGRLTILQTLAATSDAGLRRVDFGLGGDAYKAQLATGDHALLWGTAVTRGARGALGARLTEAQFAARQRAKQSDAVLRARQRMFGLRRYLPAGLSGPDSQ